MYNNSDFTPCQSELQEKLRDAPMLVSIAVAATIPGLDRYADCTEVPNRLGPKFLRSRYLW